MARRGTSTRRFDRLEALSGGCLLHVVLFNVRGELVADARGRGDGDLPITDWETGLLQLEAEG